MSLFSTTYVFLHDDKRSQEFRLLGTCVSRGAEKVRAPSRAYAVGLEGMDGARARKRNFTDAKERVRHLMKTFPTQKVVMEAYGTDGSRLDRVRFVTLSKKPPVADTPGVEGIDRIVGWIEREVKEGRLTSRRYAGICVCKHTSSGGHSDHADCAAIDIFASDHDMKAIRDMMIVESDYFRIKYHILYGTIYFPGQGMEPYHGDYHLHNHISVTGGVYNAAC